MTDQANQPAGKLLDQWRFLGYVLRHPRRPRKSATAGAVAWYLLERFDAKKGRAWPSLDTIARECSAPRSSVAEAIDWLLKEGLFEKVAGGGRGHSNAYRPCMETIRISGHVDPEPSGYPVQNSPDIQHETVRESGPNTSYDRVVPRSGSTEVSSPGAAAPPAGGGGAPSGRGVIKTPEGFDELWSAWPRHEWRRQAIEAYAAVMAGGLTDQPTLLTKAQEYAAHVAAVGTKPGLVRGLHTWLEGQGWLETPNAPPIKEPKRKQTGKATLADKSRRSAAHSAEVAKPFGEHALPTPADLFALDGTNGPFEPGTMVELAEAAAPWLDEETQRLNSRGELLGYDGIYAVVRWVGDGDERAQEERVPAGSLLRLGEFGPETLEESDYAWNRPGGLWGLKKSKKATSVYPWIAEQRMTCVMIRSLGGPDTKRCVVKYGFPDIGWDYDTYRVVSLEDLEHLGYDLTDPTGSDKEMRDYNDGLAEDVAKEAGLTKEAMFERWEAADESWIPKLARPQP